MRINTVKEIALTKEEEMAFRIVDETLRKIWETLGEMGTLESITTGECIDISEIPRTRGIIGGFVDSNMWSYRERV